MTRSSALKLLHSLQLGPLAFAAMTTASCGAVPERPSSEHPTIVSLNPCTDAILAEVAAPGQLLAISHYSHDPQASSMPAAQAALYPATGGTAEEVLAIAPDMVVASSFIAPSTRAAFERAGVRVETVGIAQTLEDSVAQVRAMGVLAGEPQRAEALAQRIEAAWRAAKYSGAPVETLLWQEGGIVPGANSLAAAMLEQSGFTLQSAARGLGQGAYLPLEQVLADPPALVLASGDEPMLTHPVLRQVQGMEYQRFDSALLYCGGPTIIRALARLKKIRADVTPLPPAGGVGGGPAQPSLDFPTPRPPPAGGRGSA